VTAPTTRCAPEGRWRDLARVHRLEYPLPIHYLCYALWGACYGAGAVERLIAVPVLLAVTANLLSPVAMNVLNGVIDVGTDARTPNKRAAAAAMRRLGAGRALWWAALEMALTLVLGLAISVWTGHWLAITAVGLMVALHVLYNIEPVRLKRRGFVNPVALGAAFGFLPCVVSCAAVRADIPISLWLIFVGLGVSVTGRALWWMVPDRAGDAATGVTTLAVRYGTHRTILLSGLVALLGLGLLGAGLWLRSGAVWAIVGLAAGAIFVIGQLTVLPGASDRALPSSARMRRYNMTPMMAANVALAVLPLVAG
jgi:4-hydroxybenzoate polyprenyltransferase